MSRTDVMGGGLLQVIVRRRPTPQPRRSSKTSDSSILMMSLPLRRRTSTGRPLLTAGETNRSPSSRYGPLRLNSSAPEPLTGVPITSSVPSLPMRNWNLMVPCLVSLTSLAQVPTISPGWSSRLPSREGVFSESTSGFVTVPSPATAGAISSCFSQPWAGERVWGSRHRAKPAPPKVTAASVMATSKLRATRGRRVKTGRRVKVAGMMRLDPDLGRINAALLLPRSGLVQRCSVMMLPPGKAGSGPVPAEKRAFKFFRGTGIT